MWVTFVLFSLGVHFTLFWLKTRRRLEGMRGSVVLDPPDLRGSKLAAAFASGMFAGTAASLGAVLLEAFWGQNPFVAPLSHLACAYTAYYFIWLLSHRTVEKLRIEHRSRYAGLRRLGLVGLLRRGAYYVFCACAPLVLLFAVLVPTTDPRTDLSFWGFAYRWTVTAPSLFFLTVIGLLWADVALKKVGGELQAHRFRYGAWGALGFALLFVNFVAWPYAALHYPASWAGQNSEGLQRLLEAPIFGFFGIAFFKCFTAEFRSGEPDKRLRLSISFRRLSEGVSFRVSGWDLRTSKLTEDYYEAVSLLAQTCHNLRLSPTETQLAHDALALGAARKESEISDADLRRLHLHHSLASRNNREKCPGKASRAPGGPGLAERCPIRRNAHRLSPSALAGSAKKLIAGSLASRRASGGAADEARAGARKPCGVPANTDSNLLARAAGPVALLSGSDGEPPGLLGRPAWEQAYAVIAAMSGLLPERAARQILDPRGKNHALWVQRNAYKALFQLAKDDADMLRSSQAYSVLARVFDGELDDTLARILRGLRGCCG